MSIITKTLKSNGYFVINKHLMKILGLNKAVILSMFIDKADYYDNEMFFYTINDIIDALGGGLSEREIRATIKSLIDDDLIIDKGMIGIPAKRFFMINEIKISELFDNASPIKNNSARPCENDSANAVKNDSANIIINSKSLLLNNTNTNNTNPNNTNPNNIKEKNLKKESPSNFKKPSLEELEIYAKEIEANFSVNQFFDYYEANGWRVGKNSMKDWRATMRMWKHRSQSELNTQNNQNPKSEISDEERNEFFAKQTSDDILSKNWLSHGVPSEVKEVNQKLDNQIEQELKRKFIKE
ncbi:hypothetical protein CVIC12175_1470 [Campylobacter vicugnae]|uniref:hypothetical protein n=1 Tax=Campylobacter vicugnae TaxID=1660076 RepID=UPI000A2F9FD0|nr:hypothetical protein [Campylobacter sp. RM12175]ARR04569.1 hypothetical protein CVIC12175_1470 [Campylobacter sp. RM12175]